jgi:hypothetical protein
MSTRDQNADAEMGWILNASSLIAGASDMLIIFIASIFLPALRSNSWVALVQDDQP